MTPEAQRITIAEACPKLFVIKKPIHAPFCYYREKGAGYAILESAWQVTEEEGLKYVSGRPTDSDRVILEPAPVPDYLNDLNAMHEAEKMLTAEQWVSYWSFLEPLACRPNNTSILHATASQRAKAFLQTINLWKP